jgi:UrcA family protein
MKIILGAAAALLSACPLGVTAAENLSTVTARVPTAGLDLNSAAGRAMLDARLRQAIRQACGAPERDLRRNAEVRRCDREMSADATQRLATMRSPAVLAAR